MPNIVPHKHKKGIPIYLGDELYELSVASLPDYPFYDDEGIYYDDDAPYNPREIHERFTKSRPLMLTLTPLPKIKNRSRFVLMKTY